MLGLKRSITYSSIINLIVYLFKYTSSILHTSYYSFFLQRTFVLFEAILRVWYTIFLVVLQWAHTPLFSLSLTMDILSSFSVQPLSLSLLHSPITFCWYPLTCFLSKDMNLFVEHLRNQFFGLFFKFCGVPLIIPNLLFFCYLFYFYCFFCFCFSSFSFLPLSFALTSLTSFLFFPFSLPLFVFAILTFSTLVSTTYYTSLNTLSSSLLLPSSQFQDCGKLAIISPKLHSTSDH